MQRLKLFIGLAAIGVASAWYAFRPELLFVNQSVDEAFPEVAAAASASETLAAGSFHGVVHKTMGIATIHKLSDGSRVLRFTCFEASNGPDVQIYLVAAEDANDNATVTSAGFLPFGGPEGNHGRPELRHPHRGRFG